MVVIEPTTKICWECWFNETFWPETFIDFSSQCKLELEDWCMAKRKPWGCTETDPRRFLPQSEFVVSCNPRSAPQTVKKLPAFDITVQVRGPYILFWQGLFVHVDNSSLNLQTFNTLSRIIFDIIDCFEDLSWALRAKNWFFTHWVSFIVFTRAQTNFFNWIIWIDEEKMASFPTVSPIT